MAGGAVAATGMLRTKRKEAVMDDVSDDFSDFSLSSPARKIRRLDADLPPIMEDVEEEVPALVFRRPRGVVIEELPPSPLEENLERAIVVFDPAVTGNPLLYSPSGSGSGFTVSVDSDLLSGLKSNYKQLWTDNKLDDNEEARRSIGDDKECMAVIPWVPSQFPPAMDATQTNNTEFMEDVDMGEASMEIDDGNFQSLEQTQGLQFGGVPQWQQQHCMVPQLPQSNPTTLTWFPVASNNM